MTDDTDLPRGRKPPTIDLTAKEIASENVRPDSMNASDAGGGEASSTSAADESSFGKQRPKALSRVATFLFSALAVVVIAGAAFFVGTSIGPDRSVTSDYEQRIEALERRTRDAARLPAPAPAPAPDGALASRLGAAEQNARTLTERLSAIDTRLQDAATLARDARDRAGSAATEAQTAQERVQSSSAADRGELETMRQRMAALEQSQKALDSGIDQKIAAATADRAMRVAVAAMALRNAVARGEPYARELETLKALAPSASTAQLDAQAAAGLPGSAALAQQLAAILPEMRKTMAATSGNASAGLVDRLQANAERLVRIRPVGAVEGAAPDAILSRAEFKAGGGDIAGAAGEIRQLPSDIQAPAQGWLAAVKARADALAASQTLSGDALTALAK